MRQHVNPLSSFFQLPKDLPKTKICFENDSLPLHLDIGSARGKFLIKLATIEKRYNFIGVEIREPLVISAERERESLQLNNLKFFFCNANISLEKWLSNLRVGQLQRVSIQFPDPWFKRRHYKRRVLQPALLISLAKALQKDTELFIQSDILEVSEYMKNLIDLSGCFERKNKSSNLWDIENPYSVFSDRELYVMQSKSPIFREVFIRNTFPVPEISKLMKED